LAHTVYEVRIFSVLENRENRLSDEGADGGNAPQNFWARTATVAVISTFDVLARNKFSRKQDKLLIICIHFIYWANQALTLADLKQAGHENFRQKMGRASSRDF